MLMIVCFFDLLISQIVVGEVVERFVFVFKEFFENSFDVGSKVIQVYFEEGGVKLICVIDDGCGIVKEELVLVLIWYVILKIVLFDDFEWVGMLGFCGEVLVLVVLVVCFVISSCECGVSYVWKLKVEICVELELVVLMVGIIVEMCDFYFNILVCCKFFKVEGIEFVYCVDVVKCLVLICFDVVFSLIYNGCNLF